MNNSGDKDLLTCCFSRGIHLELTTDISSKTFLLAVRRIFICKRTCPKKS